jgi:hypothetical protein
LVAYPGGHLFVDGNLVGRDATSTMTLQPGTHTIRVVNRFLGSETRTIDIGEGATGVLEIKW